jgi:peroxiredoxin Q/BCP
MLKQGEIAPDFTLLDENGEPHSLSKYEGKWVLLYFYPKDDTPGCTKEACALRDRAMEYEESDIVVLGVSKDSGDSHKKFISKYKLPFTLLSDPEQKVIKRYEADGGISTKRISYLIDPEGVIERVYEKVKPETHAEDVLEDLKKLK